MQLEQSTFEDDEAKSPPFYTRELISPPEQKETSPPISEEEKKLVEQILRHIELHNPVRFTAQAIIQGYPPDPQHIEQITQVLSKPNAGKWREQAIACWILGRMQASKENSFNASVWLSTILVTFWNRDSEGRMSRSIKRSMIGTYILLTFISLFRPGISPAFFFAWFPALIFSLFLYPFSSRFDRRRMNKVRTFAASGLGMHQQLIALPAVANAVFDGSTQVSDAAIWSLGRIAENLTDEDYRSAPMGTNESVCKLLGHNKPHVVLKALRILKSVGGGGAAEPVKRFLKRPSDPILHEEAQRLIPILLQRQELERQSERLLRPSSSVEGSDTLLRIPIYNNDSDPDVLLRPFESDKSS